MDVITVTARFDANGQVTPLSFIWQGRTYQVTSTGRQWDAEDGRHVMVMAASEKVFHLIFSIAEKRWYLIHHHKAEYTCKEVV